MSDVGRRAAARRPPGTRCLFSEAAGGLPTDAPPLFSLQARRGRGRGGGRRPAVLALVRSVRAARARRDDARRHLREPPRPRRRRCRRRGRRRRGGGRRRRRVGGSGRGRRAAVAAAALGAIVAETLKDESCAASTSRRRRHRRRRLGVPPVAHGADGRCQVANTSSLSLSLSLSSPAPSRSPPGARGHVPWLLRLGASGAITMHRRGLVPKDFALFRGFAEDLNDEVERVRCEAAWLTEGERDRKAASRAGLASRADRPAAAHEGARGRRRRRRRRRRRAARRRAATARPGERPRSARASAERAKADARRRSSR